MGYRGMYIKLPHREAMHITANVHRLNGANIQYSSKESLPSLIFLFSNSRGSGSEY